jgi:Na+/H+ antiporter NhaC
MSPLAFALASVLAVAAPNGAAHEEPLVEHPRFRIEVPSNVLTDVPVPKIVIRAFDANGKPDPTYTEQPLITGIRLAVPQTDDAKLGPFHAGVLELSTDLRAGRKVYISEPEIVVDAGNRRSGRMEVSRTWRWLALAPALVAFLLCLWPRNFVLAMFVAVVCGTAILEQGNLFHAFVQTIDSFVLMDASSASTANQFHITTLTVMLFFGSLFSVLAANGGLLGLTDRLSRRAKTREQGQLLALLFGFAAFFDDYAHALILGKMLRPLSDRLKISREKFAFLVDSTCAPVTAIAMISTWLAAERGTIRETFLSLGMTGGATTTLLASLPYCFYPILMLMFAALAIFIGHDFGPMLRAEWRAATQGHLSRPDLVDPQVLPAVEAEPQEGRKLARNAWIPLLLMAGLVAIGVWWTGRDALASRPTEAATAQTQPAEAPTWLDVLERANTQRVLLFSVFIASATAVALGIWSRTLTLQQGLSAWVSGLQRMVPAALILLLSWSFQRVCDADHLNTAGFLVEIGQPHVTVEWVPLVAFLAVGLTSFIVGSSWAALPLALPLFISVTHSLLVDLNEASPTHPLLLATIGAVIGGTVFGHHCSPISETTVLSSASTACSHLDHVLTQLPYALTVATVVAVFGYVPVAFGHSPVVLLPMATIILLTILQFGGRPAVQTTEDEANTKPAEAEASTSRAGGKAGPSDTSGRPEPAAAAAAGGKSAPAASR